MGEWRLLFALLLTVGMTVSESSSAFVIEGGIIGDDDRRPMRFEEFPWLGLIGVDAQTLSCSAVLVSPRIVLTAGHCVAAYNHKHFPFLRSKTYDFSFQYAGGEGTVHSGQVVAAGARVFKPKAYGFEAERVWFSEVSNELSEEISRAIRSPNEDWAIIVLDQPVKDVTKFPVLETTLDSPLACAGYPGDLDDGEYAYISIGEATPNQLLDGMEIKCDIAKGMSGGAVFSKDTSGTVLRGLISSLGHGDFNFSVPVKAFITYLAPLMLAESQNQLASFIEEERQVNPVYFLTDPDKYHLTESMSYQ